MTDLPLAPLAVPAPAYLPGDMPMKNMDSSAAITPTPKPSHTGLPTDRLPANFHQPRPEHLHQRAASTQRRQRGALGVFPKAHRKRLLRVPSESPK